MAQFSALQSRVEANLIDVPTNVATYLPTWINAGIFWLQAQHSFQIMQAELVYTTTSTPALGTSQTHIIGQLPTDWKCKRGIPYYAWYIGQVSQMEWIAEREYVYRQWGIADYQQVGPPVHLLVGEPENAQFPPPSANPVNTIAGLLNIEAWPFPDGSSDWSDGNYRIHVPYYRYLPALANSTDNNWFTVDGPAAEFVVSYATYYGFMFNEDEQRATAHKNMAMGAQYDGSHATTLGGWARTVVDMDKGIMSQPARQLAMRRDVYALRDQRRQ